MNSFRPISPSYSNVPNHTMGGIRERFEETKDLKINSALGPGSYDLRLVSYERKSSRSPIYPYERCSSPKMYHQTLPSSLIPIAQAPPVGTYEIQRWGSPSIIPPNYGSDKNTYSFNNKSRQQALGSSTCHGESKFFNESKWDVKCRDFSPGPGSYDVSTNSIWSKRNSPTSVTERVSSPLPRTINNSKPWNDYKHQLQQQQQQVSSPLNSPKTTIRKSKSELLQIQDDIDSVKRLPVITYL